MSKVACLWDSIAATGAKLGMEFHGRGASVRLSDLATGSTLGAALESLRGRWPLGGLAWGFGAALLLLAVLLAPGGEKPPFIYFQF